MQLVCSSCAAGVQLIDVVTDGGYVIDDGLATVSALVEAKSEWTSDKESNPLIQPWDPTRGKMTYGFPQTRRHSV